MDSLSPKDAPDVLYLNGNIHTMTHQKAEAIAVREGRIIALGRSAGINRLAGPETKKVDLQGGAVTPGLIDSHGHMTSLGQLITGSLDLGGTKSFQELLSAVSVRVRNTPKGDWILGARWDQENWGEKEFPTHNRLTAISPDHPVFLTRVDGHAVLVNRKAMELAGVQRETKGPVGGRILLNSDGDPTGIFVDHAMSLFHPVMPHHDGGKSEILAAQKRCLSLGLTGVHDAGIDQDTVKLYRNLDAGGELHLHIYGMLTMSKTGETFFQKRKPFQGKRFTLRAIKVFLDGALGSRGAWLLGDYADDPGNRGLPLNDAGMVEEWTRLAIEHGWQVCTHAIGDRAIRETLDAYQGAMGGAVHRLRVEHAQVAAEEDLPRFVRQGVIPSMQPAHATSDMRWVGERLGETRLRGAYAWATLLKSGAVLAAGSDFPVESPDPMKGVYAAVTRQDEKGLPEGGWKPEERLSRREAFRAFTWGGAYAAFEEEDKGSLAPGKLADFVVWSADPMTCPPKELLQIRAMRTIIGGETVFERS